MAKTYEELLAGATQIKNNELPESNTHSLVGGQLLDMVEKQKEDSERIDNVSKSHKGYFQTLEQLKAKYPTPKEGETAWVGEPYPGNVYDVVDGAWHDTGVPANEGSGSGTSNYNELENKPSIGNVSLEGDKTLDELGIASKQEVDSKQDVINQVNVNVDNETGTPFGSASVSGSTLNIDLKNIKGKQGEAGPANNITIGSVTPSYSPHEANATFRGSSPNQILDLVLPMGQQGNSGVTGSPEDLVIVNNLDGGESEVGSIKVLAAEQGKVLNEKVKRSVRITKNGIEKTDSVAHLPYTEDIDFAISDERGNAILVIDNEKDLQANNLRKTNDVSFAVTDENGNTSFGVDNDGDLQANNLRKTKDADFAIADKNGNAILIIKNGEIDFNPSISLIDRLKKKLGNIGTLLYGDVYMIPCYGQSLSLNTSAGPSTFNYVEPLSYDVNLQNANIQDMCAGTAEAFRIMAERTGVTLPDNFKIISCTGGAGGMSVLGLSKGTTYYNNVINSIKTAKQKCDEAGLILNVPCFTWTQGEEDMRCGGNPELYGTGDWNPFNYKDKLKQLIDDFNTDIKAITSQENDVLCISYQVAAHTSYKRYPRIALQQAELAKEDKRMILAKTMYDLEYVHEGGTSDPGTEGLVGGYEVHAYARSYRNIGNHYGIAAFITCVQKMQYQHLYPTNFILEGKIMYITFNVPVKPIVLDTTLVDNLPDGNYGFNVYNVDELNGKAGTIEKSDTVIESVSIFSDDVIKIVFNKEPVSGERLTYAINGDYWENINSQLTVTTGEVNDGVTKSGHLHGSRGCLRDSQDIVNEYEGAVLPYLYNWCEIFEYKI